jgi:hypothetical protein
MIQSGNITRTTKTVKAGIICVTAFYHIHEIKAYQPKLDDCFIDSTLRIILLQYENLLLRKKWMHNGTNLKFH